MKTHHAISWYQNNAFRLIIEIQVARQKPSHQAPLHQAPYLCKIYWFWRFCSSLKNNSFYIITISKFCPFSYHYVEISKPRQKASERSFCITLAREGCLRCGISDGMSKQKNFFHLFWGVFSMSRWSGDPPKRAMVLRQRPWPQRPRGQIHIARPNRWWLCWGPRPCDEYDQIRLK